MAKKNCMCGVEDIVVPAAERDIFGTEANERPFPVTIFQLGYWSAARSRVQNGTSCALVSDSCSRYSDNASFHFHETQEKGQLGNGGWDRLL